MPSQTQSANVNTLSIRSGLMIGVIVIILSIVFRLIDPLLQYTNLSVTLLSAALVVALMVILALDIRKKIGGFWKFGKAYVSLLIMSLFIALLSVLFSFVLFKYVDPDMPSKVNDATEQVTESRLQKFGLDQTQIDAATKGFTNGEFKAKLEPTFFNEFEAFAISLAFYAVIDLIIAACVKKNLPPFIPADELEA